MASYKPPKNHPIFNPIDFANKDDGLEGDTLEIVPPLIDQGVAFLKEDAKLHTDYGLMYDDSTQRLGIGPAAYSTLNGGVYSRLTISPTDFEKKITIYGSENDHTGFGASANALNYHVEQVIDSHKFFSTGTNDNGYELMRIQGNSNVGISTNAPNAKLHVVGPSTLEGTTSIKASTFNALATSGTIASCSPTTDFPVVIQSTDNTNNLTKTALAFSASSNSATAPEADISFTRTADAPARGKLDVNLITGTTNKENVMSFQSDRTLITKKVGINQTAPLTTLHVGGDAIVSNIGIGTGAIPSLKISMPSVEESKICLHPGSTPSTSFYGVGVGASAINYQVENTAAYHVFRSAGKNNDGNQIIAFRGNGAIQIAGASAVGKMTFNNVNEKKITLYSTDGVSHTGFETKTQAIPSGGTVRDVLCYNLQNSEAEHHFYATRKVPNVGTETTQQLMRVYWSEYYDYPQLYIGTGQTRNQYQLELELDQAGKPGFGGYWTNTSDRRIKEDIQNADLNICYDVVKNVP